MKKSKDPATLASGLSKIRWEKITPEKRKEAGRKRYEGTKRYQEWLKAGLIDKNGKKMKHPLSIGQGK